jgi:cytochrome c553
MTSTIRALCCAIALLAAPAAVQAAGDAAAGKTKAYTCLGCHGIADYKNVYPTYHVPKLAGQNADYIVAALTAYANGERTHETMHAHAASLSAEDIQDIAAYFASSGQ